jgi:hypothetical protein
MLNVNHDHGLHSRKLETRDIDFCVSRLMEAVAKAGAELQPLVENFLPPFFGWKKRTRAERMKAVKAHVSPQPLVFYP